MCSESGLEMSMVQSISQVQGVHGYWSFLKPSLDNPFDWLQHRYD